MERPGQEITGRTARVSKVLRRSQRESEKLRHVKTVTYKVDSVVHSPRQDMCSEQHLRDVHRRLIQGSVALHISEGLP